MRLSTAICRLTFAHLARPVIDAPAVAGSDARTAGRPPPSWGRGLFDFDVDQDEPVLVIQVDEILDRVDVPERDRPEGSNRFQL